MEVVGSSSFMCNFEELEDLDLQYFDLDNYELDGSINIINNENVSCRKRKADLQELQQLYKLPRPRIIKSDFRRTFPQVWATVFNSGDYRTMMNHINAFYEHEVKIMQQDLRPFAIARGNLARGPSVGHANLAEFWYQSMKLAPDLVCTLKHTFVKVRSDGTSSIKCNFGLSGTKFITVQEHDPNAAACITPLIAKHIQTESSTSSIVDNDALDRFVCDFSDSHDCNMSSTASVTSTDCSACTTSSSTESESVDSLEDVLQRYLKAAAAVSRSRARRRRKEVDREDRQRRCRHPQPVPSVSEWLSIPSSDAGSGSEECCSVVQAERSMSSVQYASVAEAVCRFPVDGHTLRDENNQRVPSTRKYNLQHDQRGAVLLTSHMDYTCSIVVNFNAHNKIETMVLNYLN